MQGFSTVPGLGATFSKVLNDILLKDVILLKCVYITLNIAYRYRLSSVASCSRTRRHLALVLPEKPFNIRFNLF
jgi:hypothetical protein